ncbi:PE family protein [Mycobacterium kansasii]|uniref:PE family protein n=1 Tax=Mycobacterium kansasii TaxID=1768 RepID=A0A1V3X312_MYCKA|nr:PE family protein [Mycobacterium kansasii]
MSYLTAFPELLASAATDLSNIGSALIDANTTAAAPSPPWCPLPPMRYQQPSRRCSPTTRGHIRCSAARRTCFTRSLSRR